MSSLLREITRGFNNNHHFIAVAADALAVDKDVFSFSSTDATVADVDFGVFSGIAFVAPPSAAAAAAAADVAADTVATTAGAPRGVLPFFFRDRIPFDFDFTIVNDKRIK